MFNSSFKVILALLVFICTINENEAGITEGNVGLQSSEHPHQPFIVVTSTPETQTKKTHPELEILPLSSAYKLPTEFIKEGNEWHLASGSEYKFKVPLCPELKIGEGQALYVLEILRRVLPGSNKCLFVKDYENNCEREPELSLDIREDNGSAVICGLNNHQKLVDAQYYNCGSVKHVTKYITELGQGYSDQDHKNPPPFKPLLHRIYEICYDFHHRKTLWTRHSPMTPALLAHPGSPYSKLSNEFHLKDFNTSTSSLNLHETVFSDLKKSYESTDHTVTTAFIMVPKDHMALHYWKKATTHMINAAPLSPEFVHLMNAINNGIFRASSNLFAKTQKTLQIYTHTHAETNLSTILNLFHSTAALLTDKKPDLFESNIWYRFVYNENEKSGVLIVLHNTRQQLPEQKECKDDELLHCDFRSWSSSPELIPDKSLDHAYCCILPGERIKRLFSIKELVLEKKFDIQEVIKETQKELVESLATDINDNQGKPDHYHK